MGFICLMVSVDGRSQVDLNINGNPFNCDCKDYDVISKNRVYRKSQMLDKAHCEQPSNLYDEKVYSIQFCDFDKKS